MPFESYLAFDSGVNIYYLEYIKYTICKFY
jgi:hypothetical protein